ncbi:hypothetical protein V6N13_046930 [Hibiscus sabdariffa]|uniref:Uncharacterized protein n=1 Tax=Hibiscus sabdariffa TaxID=183260 RepID=A0ABR2ACU3_9ROSI
MTESFGPWMMIECRQRQNHRKDSIRLLGYVPSVIQESRFNPIFEEDPHVAPNSPPTTSTAVASLSASVPTKPVSPGILVAPSDEVDPPVQKDLVPAAVIS